MRLLDHRQQGAIDAPARLQQRCVILFWAIVGLLGWVEAFQGNSAVAFVVYLAGRPRAHPDLHHTTGQT